MERPVFQPVGTPADELDTPALVVDLELMERNIRLFQQPFAEVPAKIRPVVTSHLCPQIARRQLAAGGASGIAVATVGEAEVFAAAGFSDILLANQIVTRPKLRRLGALAVDNRITVAVDSPGNVAQLSAAAGEAGGELGVLVEIEAGMGRCGVAPGADAVALGRAVEAAPGLRFAGIMATVPGPSGANPEEHRAQTRQRLQTALEAKDLMESAGLAVPSLSVGGAHCQPVAREFPAITEVRAGRYPLMDWRLQAHLPELAPAAWVLATVISAPAAGMSVLDAGHKATGPDQGLPRLPDLNGVAATRFSAEHGVIEFAEGAAALPPGAKARLIPYELGACLNQYDYLRAVRGGKLEGFWPLSARGKFA